jgi:hypothetical protein
LPLLEVLAYLHRPSRARTLTGEVPVALAGTYGGSAARTSESAVARAFPNRSTVALAGPEPIAGVWTYRAAVTRARVIPVARVRPDCALVGSAGEVHVAGVWTYRAAVPEALTKKIVGTRVRPD